MKFFLYKTPTTDSWERIRSNWLLQTVNKSVIFLVVISLALIAWRWRSMPPFLPLWYSRPWGSDQLAQPGWIFILPVSGLLLYGINLLMSIYLTAEYLIFTQALFLTSLLVNILSFIALFKILFLVA